MEEITDYLIPEDKREYKCYDLLKEALEKDTGFCKTILEGIRENKIRLFDDELLEKLNKLNIRGTKAKNIEELLFHGGNIGACTSMSLQLSFIIPGATRCSGILPILKGTFNSPNGEHTWLETSHDVIYDASLMLIIDKSYKDKLGYQEEARMKYESMRYYYEKKDFATDESLSRPKVKTKSKKD